MNPTDLLPQCRRVSALIEHGVISSEDAASVAAVLHAAERSLATESENRRLEAEVARLFAENERRAKLIQRHNIMMGASNDV